MPDLNEKVCIACLPDAEPASMNEIEEFIGNSDWQFIKDDGFPQILRKYKFQKMEINLLVLTEALSRLMMVYQLKLMNLNTIKIKIF